MENRNDEILFEEFLELTERELRSAGIQLLERVTVGNFTSHKFTDGDNNVYTIKSWSSDNGGKYPSTIDKFYSNGSLLIKNRLNLFFYFGNCSK